MRWRLVALVALVAVVAGAVGIRANSARHDGQRGVTVWWSDPVSTSSSPPRPTLAARPVNVPVDGFLAWALLDRTTGEIAGSDNLTATNSSESMIKVWIVADFLRRAAEQGAQPTPDELAQASAAIRDSNNAAAQALYVLGGRDEVVHRMVAMCQLTESTVGGPPQSQYHGWWSYTQISARDAVRLGECVKNGTAAGSRWTSWLLAEMAQVRGTAEPKDHQTPGQGGGRWGIIDGLPESILQQGPVAIKNGWTLLWADGMWHVNCLAVAERWVLAVLMRYPHTLGLQYGAAVCRSVTEQLAPPQPSSAAPGGTHGGESPPSNATG
jgi:hypothetical protein